MSPLEQLYRRYKALALSVGAGIAVGRPSEDAGAAVAELLADCERAAASAGAQLSEAFEACREAVLDLEELVGESAAGGTPSASTLEATRESHRRLRKLVWELTECEYVPCSGHEVPVSVGSRGERG